MRRPRFQKQAVSVSLFPFLAVLICTMGALILLLVLVVKQADVQASQRHEEDAAGLAEASRQLAIEKEDEDYRQSVLRQLRPGLTKRLADRRKELGHLEEQVRLLRERAQSLQKETEDLASTGDERFSDRAALETKLAELSATLARARRKLDQARKTAANQPRSFAIIPYEGPHGTRRRPVYIECTSRGVTFQPEGVTLTPQDLAGPLIPGNPLDAAVLATREYLLRHHGIDSHSEPYPLLIVRPDGTATYDLARRAMKSWDDEFGYELIDGDLQLKYPHPDPNLKRVLEQAIKDARRKQQILARMQPSRFRGTASGGTADGNGLGNSPSGGGFLRAGLVVPRGENLNQAGRRSTDQKNGSRPGPQGSASRSTSATARSTSATGQGRAVEATTGPRDLSGTEQPRSATTETISPRRSSSSSRSGTGPAGQTGGDASLPSLAAARGSNWALQQRTPGATAIRRPIRVVCLADRVVIVAERDSTQPSQEVPVPGPLFNSVDNIVSAVWSHVESWGTAGRNAYWKPELKVEVPRGGEQRFNELRALFRNSGFDVEKVR